MDLLKIALYRFWTWLRHQLTSRHTGGHGVHSPYLFEWTSMIMSDKNVYYAWGEIESLRQSLQMDNREVLFTDYGSGSSVNGAQSRRIISEIAKSSLAKKKYAQMLARLVRWMGDSQGAISDGQLAIGKGLNIVELGTSLGITTAYLAAMDSRNSVLTCEGCAAVAEIAMDNWKRLGLSNIDCKVGELTVDGLRLIVDGLPEDVDVAFVDANHTYASTCAYFNVLAKKVHDKSVIVVDDIHYNPEMERAWNEICADSRVTSTIDLYQMGMVFFDKHYWKRNYRMCL